MFSRFQVYIYKNTLFRILFCKNVSPMLISWFLEESWKVQDLVLYNVFRTVKYGSPKKKRGNPRGLLENLVPENKTLNQSVMISGKVLEDSRTWKSRISTWSYFVAAKSFHGFVKKQAFEEDELRHDQYLKLQPSHLYHSSCTSNLSACWLSSPTFPAASALWTLSSRSTSVGYQPTSVPWGWSALETRSLPVVPDDFVPGWAFLLQMRHGKRLVVLRRCRSWVDRSL